MKALITGIGGFVGRHLAQRLLDAGCQVSGIERSTTGPPMPPEVEVASADLLDRGSVDALVQRVRPDRVYHLAAQSSTGDSLADPWGTVANNMRGQVNLCEALLAASLKPRILVIGSSEEYGAVEADGLPTSEDSPLRPPSPYAMSKVGQDMLGYQYFAQHGLPIVRVRPFSHTGPGHDPRFVVPSFARQIAQIEAGERPPEMRVGNLDIWRDFSDVRDVVRAYELVLEGGRAGDVYNVGSGSSVRLGDVLQDLLAECRVSVQVTVDPALLRPSDIPRQQADVRKLQALTGWCPKIPWPQTLRDTLDDWRQQVSAGAAARA